MHDHPGELSGDMKSPPRDSALLILDVINTFDFPGGEPLLAHTRQIMPSILALRDRYDAAGQPVIYANDNFGRWRSELSELVEYCSRDGAKGAAVVRALAPLAMHYSVLKPRQSAFFETPLKLLLDELHTQALTIVGIAGDQCVLASAMNAHLRDYALWVPSDATASITQARNDRALAYLDEVLGARITSTGER